jgi:hypothetical protein
MLSEPEIHSIAPHEEGAKCAQIAKEWLDKGLAKCHEIAVLYPSSRNPPAWIGKIHCISFVDTSAQISPFTSHSQLHHAGVAKREGGPPPVTSHQLPATRHSGFAAIPLPANPVLLSKMLSDPEIRPIIRAHLGHPRLKNAFIRRNSCFSWFLNFS